MKEMFEESETYAGIPIHRFFAVEPNVSEFLNLLDVSRAAQVPRVIFKKYFYIKQKPVCVQYCFHAGVFTAILVLELFHSKYTEKMIEGYFEDKALLCHSAVERTEDTPF